jgi:hypothetical protein
MGELPSDRRPDLSHFLGGAKAVKPRRQRRLQGRGNHEGWRRNRRSSPSRLGALRLQHRLGHLLDEQGNAVAAFNDVAPSDGRQRLVADHMVNHGADLALRQSIQDECGHVRLSDPGRVEFRSECHDQQRAKAPNAVHRPAERFEARRVNPLRILEDHQNWTGARQSLDLRNERLLRSLPALLRGQLDLRVASIVRQRQHVRKEGDILSRGRGERQQRVKLVEFRLRTVVARQSGGALHFADDRKKGIVGVLRRTEISQASERLIGKSLHERGGEARFADPGLAGKENDLAFAALCRRPAPRQQFAFFFAPDESGQVGGMQRLEVVRD